MEIPGTPTNVYEQVMALNVNSGRLDLLLMEISIVYCLCGTNIICHSSHRV